MQHRSPHEAILKGHDQDGGVQGFGTHQMEEITKSWHCEKQWEGDGPAMDLERGHFGGGVESSQLPSLFLLLKDDVRIPQSAAQLEVIMVVRRLRPDRGADARRRRVARRLCQRFADERPLSGTDRDLD